MATVTKNVPKIIGLKELRENMSTYIRHTEQGSRLRLYVVLGQYSRLCQ